MVNLDDCSLDNVPIVEVFDGLVDGGEQVFFRPNVVHCNLRRRDARLLGAGGHVVMYSETDDLVDGQN